jgi:hypothetical protein
MEEKKFKLPFQEFPIQFDNKKGLVLDSNDSRHNTRYD